MNISVIVTTYNREKDCLLCLESLLPQVTKNVEILLLDDYHLGNSTLQNFCVNNNIKYIHTGIQKNFQPIWRVPGFALNIGVKRSRGEYLIIGNAEIYQVSNNTLEKMYETKGLSSPIVYSQPNGGKLENYKKFQKENNKLPFFLGVPRNLFFALGGYDEDFTGYAWEDTDLANRLQSVTRFNEVDAEVVHLWNSRGMQNRADASNLTKECYIKNKKLFEDKKGVLYRNVGKTWGSL